MKQKAPQPPGKPGFWPTRLALYAVSGMLGAFAVYEWAAPMWDENPVLAGFVGTVFGVSALVTPAVCSMLARARILASLGLLFAAVAFGALDVTGLSIGLINHEKAVTEAPYMKALSDHQAQRTPLLELYTAAQANLAALPTSTAACEGYGPRGCTKRLEGLAADRAALAIERDTAKADLAAFDALPLPQRGDIYDNRLVIVLAAALQLALALAFASVEATRTRLHTDALAAFEKAETIRQKEIAKAKKDRLNQKKPKAAPQPSLPFRPHLVGAND